MIEIKACDLAVCLALFDSFKTLRSLRFFFPFLYEGSLPFDRDKILGVNTG